MRVDCLVSFGSRLQPHILPPVGLCSHLTDRILMPGQRETASARARRCKETETGIGRKHQMDTRRTIGEAPGSSGPVDSRRPAKDRVNRANVNRGARIVIMAMPIVTLAQASRSYVSRMLCNGVFVLLVGVCIGAVAAHAQNATWGTTPGSSNWNTAVNWVQDTVPTGTATFGA